MTTTPDHMKHADEARNRVLMAITVALTVVGSAIGQFGFVFLVLELSPEGGGGRLLGTTLTLESITTIAALLSVQQLANRVGTIRLYVWVKVGNLAVSLSVFATMSSQRNAIPVLSIAAHHRVQGAVPSTVMRFPTRVIERLTARRFHGPRPPRFRGAATPPRYRDNRSTSSPVFANPLSGNGSTSNLAPDPNSTPSGSTRG